MQQITETSDRKRGTHLVVETLPALSPQNVPQEALSRTDTNEQNLLRTLTWLGSDPSQTRGVGSMLVAIESALRQIASPAKPIQNPESQEDDLAHDAYFQVQRVEGDRAEAFVETILRGRLALLKESMSGGVTLNPEYLERIDKSLAELLLCFAGGEACNAGYVKQWELRVGATDALQRWVHGHHTFLALTQGLVFSLQAMGKAFQSGNRLDVQKWADLSISLLDGSSAAFLFTGDFAPEDYEEIIRPSMTPPLAPVGLSGLMSIDHRQMAQIMRDMRPDLKALAEQEPERHKRMSQAMANVYDSHIFVCEQFVGAKPSLLTEGRTERTGPSLLDQFKMLRMKPFENSQRVQRLEERRAPRQVGECPFQH